MLKWQSNYFIHSKKPNVSNVISFKTCIHYDSALIGHIKCRKNVSILQRGKKLCTDVLRDYTNVQWCGWLASCGY